MCIRDRIEGWQLRKAIFPIGHYEKGEVRQIAEREHLVNARRKDSQGICFLGNIDYNEYVRRYVGELEGDVIELETGRLVGRHKGHWFHTCLLYTSLCQGAQRDEHDTS